jgi:hypothetical protein
VAQIKLAQKWRRRGPKAGHREDDLSHRLRYPDRLRRPRWRNGQLKLTFHLDHSAGANHNVGGIGLAEFTFLGASKK